MVFVTQYSVFWTFLTSYNLYTCTYIDNPLFRSRYSRTLIQGNSRDVNFFVKMRFLLYRSFLIQKFFTYVVRLIPFSSSFESLKFIMLKRMQLTENSNFVICMYRGNMCENSALQRLVLYILYCSSVYIISYRHGMFYSLILTTRLMGRKMVYLFLL